MRTPWWVVSEANVVSTCQRELQAVPKQQKRTLRESGLFDRCSLLARRLIRDKAFRGDSLTSGDRLGLGLGAAEAYP
jgi:hypothetical protein